jgi:hypothetical protein
MYESNLRAIAQYDSNSDWLIAHAEFAPIVMRGIDTSVPQSKWVGRDGGATTIEHILNVTPNIKPYVVGVAAEWRLNEIMNAERDEGAYGNQVFWYQQYGVSFAQELLRRGELDVPDYLRDYLNTTSMSTPLQHDDYPEELFDLLKANTKLCLANSDFKYRYNSLKGKYGKNAAQEVISWEAQNSIALSNCASISSLYLMNHMFTKELGVPEDQIFMGVMAPPMARFVGINSPTMTNYLKEFSLNDLLTIDE